MRLASCALSISLCIVLGGWTTRLPAAQAAAPQVRLTVRPNTTARTEPLQLSPALGVIVQIEPMRAPFDGAVRVYVFDEADVLVAMDDPEQGASAFSWAPAQPGRYRVAVANTNRSDVTMDVRTTDGATVRSGATQAGLATVRVWFATNRAPLAGLVALFGTDPAPASTYGYSDVSIPRDHRMGALEAPSIWKLEFRDDPAKHVSILKIEREPVDGFFEQVRDRVLQSPNRQALIFVHGFNESFEDAMKRTAQIAYDLAFDGPAIAFSWPSQGRLSPLDYTKDQRNADVSAEALSALIAQLRTRVGTVTIHLIAHSMGNRVLARALENMPAPTGARPLQEVAMMAPDVDAALFRQAVGRIALTAQRITLYASSQDTALKAAEKIAGYPRAGEGGSNILVVRGIETVDASAVETSVLGLGHSYYADNSTILSDLFALIRGRRAEERFGLEKKTTANGVYWQFRPAVR